MQANKCEDISVHWIQNYLRNQIEKLLRPKSDEFVPLVTKKINSICDTWLELVRRQAKRSEFSFRARLLPDDRNFDAPKSAALEGINLFDEEGLRLIISIFKSRYDVEARYKNMSGQRFGENSILDVLPPGSVFNVEFFWSPLNSSVYGESKPLSAAEDIVDPVQPQVVSKSLTSPNQTLTADGQ